MYPYVILSHIEAEYAEQRKRRIIPLKYENHDPTGWLGLLIGRLIYHDVRSDEALEKSFEAIMKDIRGEPLPAASSGKGMWIKFGRKATTFNMWDGKELPLVEKKVEKIF